MNKQREPASNDMGARAEDARALMAATADVAGEKVSENPYQAVAIGVGVGVLIGRLAARRCSRNSD